MIIHGLKKPETHLLYPEISVSLHGPGLKPLYDYGFILHVHNNGIIASYASDVTSCVINNKKCFRFPLLGKKYKDYGLDFESLLQATAKGKHNEIWVDTGYADVVGCYVVTGSKAVGLRTFLKNNKDKIVEELNA